MENNGNLNQATFDAAVATARGRHPGQDLQLKFGPGLYDQALELTRPADVALFARSDVMHEGWEISPPES